MCENLAHFVHKDAPLPLLHAFVYDGIVSHGMIGQAYNDAL